MRTFDVDIIDSLTSPYSRYGFDKNDWGEGSRNVALVSGNDLSLFEFVKEGHYRGHYFYESRGRAAITKAEEALREIFKTAEVVEGWTPLENKAAAWLSRHLGFKEYGIIETIVGPMWLFIMTRIEYEQSIRGQ